MSNSTLSGNSATVLVVIGKGGGGGIFNSGTLAVIDSTISSNSSRSDGGGIYNGGTLTVSASTLSANSATDSFGSGYSGGGIYTYSGTPLLQNTIVAGNSSSSSGPDIFGPVSSTSSYNLVGNSDGLSGISDGVDHNQIGSLLNPIDPLLGPLGDYGGPTQTMPLLPGSPALNTGDPSQAGTPDQRGVIRTGGVNIGAFQASAAYLVVTAPDTATAGVAFDLSVAVVDVFGQRAVGYTGTITLTTTDPDPGVILPPDYTFQAGDGGVVTFSAGVTLFTAGDQTLTVTDLDSGITDSTVVTL